MAWVAVSEATSAHGKQQSITRITRTITTVAMLSGGAAIAAPPALNQLPTGGQVAAGIAAIGVSSNTMTVTQSSNRAAINWNTFDIGSQAAVNFVQPSSQAVALNRVLSNNPSQIFGQLSSNGQVYLINAAGIYFAPGAQVNVGGIVATTMNMTDADFMAGKNTFDRNGSTGKVINEGTIQTSLNGYIAMLAPEVRNSGLLLAQSGTVVMAAGERITLNFGPTSKLDSITVTEAQIDTLVENRYAVKAPNGLVILSARAANQLAASVINSGTIEAKGVSQQGGRILLEGSTVTNTGTLDVTSDTAKAGTIQINGKNVSISGNVVATTPAQNTQGGSVKVSATQSLNVANANINVSASQGGQIQLSANQLSVADSNINADGDTQGGSVQISATASQSNNPFHDPLNIPTLPATLAATGFTSISSRGRRGQGGNVTLTGDEITLDGNTNINVSGATGGGNALIGGDWQGSNGTYQATTVYMGANTSIDASATDTGNGGKVVLWSDIHNVNGWTNVYGSIYAMGGVNGGDGGRVETSGHGVDSTGVTINAGSTLGHGGLWFIDPYDYTIDATAATSIVTTLNTGTSVTIDTSNNTGPGAGASGSGNISINSAINKTAGAAATLTFNAANWIAGTGNIGSTSNALSVVFNAGGGPGIYSGVISGSGSFTKLGAGTTILTGANTYSGGTTVSAGTLQLGNGGTTGTLGTGNITVDNATLTFNYSAGNYTVGSNSTATYITLNNATINALGGNMTLAGFNTYGSDSHPGATNASVAINIYGSNTLNAATGTALTLSGTTTGAQSAGIYVRDSAVLNSSGNVSLAAFGNGASAGMNCWAMVLGNVTTINALSNSTLNLNATGSNNSTLLQYGNGSVSTSTTGNVTINVSGSGSSAGMMAQSTSGPTLPINFSSANGTLTFNFSGTGNPVVILYGVGNNQLVASSTGNIVFNGADNPFIPVGGDCRVVTGAGNLTINNSVATNGYNLMFTNGSGFVTINGIISGTGSLTQATTGTTVLTGANSYAGTTNISAGTLALVGSGILGSGATTIQSNGTLQVGNGTTSGIIPSGLSSISNSGLIAFDQASGTSWTVSDSLSSTGGLIQMGSGSTVILTGSNTYTGATTVSAGTLQVGNGTSGNLAATTAISVASGATLLLNEVSGSTFGNAVTDAGTVNFAQSGTLTATGIISSTGAVIQSGSGTTTLTRANTYTGTTTITSGTLQLNSGGTINNSSNITDNGTLAYNNSAVNTAALVSGSGSISVGTASSTGTTLQLTSTLGVAGALRVYSGNVLDLNGYSSPNEITISGTGISNGGALINSNATAGSQSGAVTLAGATSIGGSGNFTIGGVIGGAYALTKVGTNTITLSGANTYSGGTTVSGGTLKAGASSGSGNSPFGTGDVTVNGVSSGNLATVDLNGKTISNNISMSSNASLVNNATGSAVLTGALTLLADTSTSTVANGSLTLGSIVGNNHTFRFDGGAGSSYVQAGVASNLSAYTLVLPTTGNLTLNGAVTVNGTVRIQSGTHVGNIAINAALQATGSNGIWLDGNITQTAALTAGELYLNGNAVLTNTANNVSLLTADTIANLTYVNANALTVGSSSTFGSSGVNATGSVNISTQTGNLTLTQAVSTSSTATNAVVLNAASTVAAGTATGGNILVSGGTVSVGSGGRAVLYTGSIANSTGVTALVGSGSGNFRYNSNASSQGYTLALGAGVSAVYREQPSLTVTAANNNITYGTAPTLSASSNGVNGDTDAQIFGSNTPTFNVTGNTSTSGNYVAGNHTIVVSGGTNQLGYASPSYVNGTLAVAQKTLTVTGTTVSNKVYDGNATAAVTNGTLVGVVSNGSTSDVVTLTQAGNFSQANAGNNLTVTTTDSISGTDAANYVLTQPTGLTANITTAPLTIAANSTSKTYGQIVSFSGTEFTTSGLVNGETVTSVTLNSTGSGNTSSVGGYNITASSASGAGTTTQFNTANYNISYVNGTLTVNPANLGVAYSGTYNGTTGYNNVSSGYTLTGLQNGETISTANLAIANANVAFANNYVTGLTVIAGNASMSNYVLSGSYNATAGTTRNTVALTAAPLTITAQAANMTYSGTGYTGGNVSYSGFVGGDSAGSMSGTIAYSGNSQGAINAGTYTITASGQSNSNYAITYVNGVLTINPAPLGVVATGVYNGTTTLVPNSYSVAGLVNGETLTSLSAVTVSNANVAANTYVTAISSGGGTANLNNYQITQAYNASPNTTSTNAFTMAKANLTVSADNAASFIGLGLPTSYNVSYTGFVNGQTASTAGLTTGSVANSATGSSGAGNYTLTPSGFSANNYSISYTNGTYTIVPADALIVQVGSKSMAYGTSLTTTTGLYGTPTVLYMANGSAVVTLTYNASLSSGNHYVYNDNANGSVSFNLAVVNGSYSTSNNLVAGSGYQLNSANVTPTGGNLVLTNGTTTTGALAVNALALTASTSNVSKVYDGTTAMTGMNIGLSPVVSGDIVTANGNGAFGQANVGTNISYNVTGLILGGTDAENYYLTGGSSFSGNNGVITAAPLTITANNANKTYGSTATLSGTAFSSVGLVANQTIGNVTLTSSGAVNTANAGNYSIAIGNASGGTFAASNYNISYSNGTLTVNQAPLGISAAGVENGTTTITPTGYTLTGLQNNETLMVGSVTVASASPGMANNYVTALNGVTGTALLSNYRLNSIYDGTPGTNLTNSFAMTAKPKPATDNWVYQQTMVQGGTMVYIPLPKVQVKESRGSHKALAFADSVELVADAAPENATEPGFMAQPEAGFTDRFFGTAPRIISLPEAEGSKLIQHGDRLIIVNTNERVTLNNS